MSFLQKAFILVFLCPFMCCQAQQKTKDIMSYRLSWDGKSEKILVDLQYDNHGRDSTVFTFGNPNPGGLTRIFDILKNIHTDRGAKWTTDSGARKIVVLHTRKGRSRLQYEIDGTLVKDPKRARPNEAFRPTAGQGFLYTLGYNLYLEPTDTLYKKISVRWGKWPKHMTYFISADPEAKPSDRITVAMKDKNSLLIQMNENLVKDKYVVNGIPSYLLTSRSDTLNHMKEEMKPFVTRLIPHMRDFWNDNDFKFYFISMIPLRNEVSSTMTGIGLINGFGTRYSGPLDKDKTAIIAHEISHTWIGVRLRIASKGMENTWFGEGFNDYVAIYNLTQTGMFSSEDFLRYVNRDIFEPYYNNPENTLPGDAIEAGFWKNKNIEKIPYHRGFIYAFYLDQQIRQASEGKFTLQDFMLRLLSQAAEQKKREISPEEFAAAASGFLPAELVLEQVHTYMLGGKLIDFRQAGLADGFSIMYQGNTPVLSLPQDADLKKVFR